MWQTEQTPRSPPTIYQYTILQNRNQLTFAQFIGRLIEDADFRTYYNDLLANNSFPAFFWEHPPLTRSEAGEKPYEFVLVRADALSRVAPEPRAFAQHFHKKDAVTTFSSLGGDAQLIAPAPRGDASHYTHLAGFVRRASKEQQDAFWKRVGEEYARAIERGKRWLSTSGLGMYWLHVRIDQRPKYYQFRAYRSG